MLVSAEPDIAGKTAITRPTSRAAQANKLISFFIFDAPFLKNRIHGIISNISVTFRDHILLQREKASGSKMREKGMSVNSVRPITTNIP